MHNQEQKITVLGCFIWLLAVLFFLYEFFLRTFVGTVAHQIIPELHLTTETFALLGAAYFIAYGIMQIPVGLLCDKFGVKRIMILATLICAAATYLFAHSTNFFTAFASRFFMGFGSSFAFVCLLTVALTWFPRRYFGFFAGASQFFGTMGPLLAGGPLITMIHDLHETWRQALIMIGLSGVILAIFILLFVKNQPRNNKQKLFLLKRREPTILQIKRLARNRQAWFIALYSALVYISVMLLAAMWGTEYLEIKGFSQLTAAYIISICWIGYAIGCPFLGATSDFLKRRKPNLIIAAVIGLVSISSIILYKSPNIWIFSSSFFLLGLAASGQNVGFATISEQVDTRIKSTALGLNNGMITAFSVVTPIILGWIIELSASGKSTHLTQSNFLLAFSIMPIFYFIAIIISIFFIEETYCKPQKELLILFPGQ